MKSVLKFSVRVAVCASICASLAACSSNNSKGEVTTQTLDPLSIHYKGNKPIKPADQTMVLGASNVQELELGVKKAQNTDKNVRIVLTPGYYSIKKTIVLPKNTTLTTFNPTNGGKNGPWIISDVKDNEFIGPVILMHPGSAIKGVNVKQLNSNNALEIRKLPVTIESLQLQTTKDQSLIFIDSPLVGHKKSVLTLKGVTLTNMYLHKTSPSIRVGYSAPITVKFIDSVINYPKGQLILPKETNVEAINTVFNTDLSGLSHIKLKTSTYHKTHELKKGIITGSNKTDLKSEIKSNSNNKK
jgi:hypothetical protein